MTVAAPRRSARPASTDRAPRRGSARARRLGWLAAPVLSLGLLAVIAAPSACDAAQSVVVLGSIAPPTAASGAPVGAAAAAVSGHRTDQAIVERSRAAAPAINAAHAGRVLSVGRHASARLRLAPVGSRATPVRAGPAAVTAPLASPATAGPTGAPASAADPRGPPSFRST